MSRHSSAGPAARSTSAPAARRRSAKSSTRWPRLPGIHISRTTGQHARVTSCASSWTHRSPNASWGGAQPCRCTRVWRRRTPFSVMAPTDTHVGILAGGEGTRLWPLSRSRRPKQLLALSGQRSLVQQTVDRLKPLVDPERILIVTERSHADDLRAQLPELPDSSIIVEPTRRGTAAALLLAALHVRDRAPDATWASLHSDAFI